MPNGSNIALPPFTRWVKRILIGHAVLYVLWLVLGRWAGIPEIARQMMLVPADVHAGKVWQLFTYIVSFSNPGVFLTSMLALWMFGGELELRLGTRRFLFFYFGISILSGIVVTLLALGIDLLATLPVLGPGASILGIVIAWGVYFAHRQVYFFGVVPLSGRAVMLIVLGVTALWAIATTPAAFVNEAVGALIAFFWVKGWGRPTGLRDAWLLWRSRRARRHLKVVKGDDRRFLH
jgi:membrane associated rhomboid family serine protease